MRDGKRCLYSLCDLHLLSHFPSRPQQKVTSSSRTASEIWLTGTEYAPNLIFYNVFLAICETATT